jgi:3-hydroxybutyrate dehydrogenase
MAQCVKGKTAIITGAGSGLNLALATKLLKKGCNVVIADLSLRPEAEALVDPHPPTMDEQSSNGLMCDPERI